MGNFYFINIIRDFVILSMQRGNKMFKNSKRKEEIEVKEYPYLDLLSDNSPQAFSEYYEDAAILNKQINEPNVYNIAIVAKYGAGKSSVINTYLSRYRNNKTRKEKKETNNKQLAKPENNKYTRISLSTFNKTDYDEIAIERSILQQLLYSRKKSNLPNSKIERTNKTSKSKSVLFAIMLTAFIVSTALMGVEFSLFGRDIGTMGVTSLFGASWVKYFLLGLSAFLLFWIVLWVLHYRKLKKIKYKDLEADITQEDDKAKSKQVTNLINKFIDEVLYFFECIDIDLVIFEDLDRLPTTEIFVKLRELNTIINSSAKRAKKVTFLYAVKDELFKTEEERAKFFEFILPVVPVLNPVTTKSEIESRLDRLTAINKNMELTGKFIKGISTYIPDMRVLKNTFNDYVMMYHKIFEDVNASKILKTDNLFALCLYKNLFPYDYALLEKNEGLIPLVVDLESLKTRSLKEINIQIEECKNKVNELQNESITSFEELKGIFISQLAKCRTRNSSYSGTINPWTITTFKDLDFFRVQYPYIQYGAYNNGYSVALQNGEEVLTPRGERFIDVENRIKAKEEGEIEKAKSKLIELENQKRSILSWGLVEIVKNEGVNFCFDGDLNEKYKDIIKINLSKNDSDFLKFLSSKYVNKIGKEVVETIRSSYKDFAKDKLSDKQIALQINYLKFLVAQNYIDEHFIEYTSNYKAEILSPADIKVVQNIQSGQLDFNANFENILEVARWLDEEDFSSTSVISKEILDNIALIQELSLKENDRKYDNLIKLISNKDKPLIFSCLKNYLNLAEENRGDELLKHLIPYRGSLCEEVILDDKLHNNKQDLVLTTTIKYSVDYKYFENNEIINQYLSNHNEYLKVLSSINEVDKVKRFLNALKPEIKILVKSKVDDVIQEYIIENSLYAINLGNFETIFNVDAAILDCDFYTKNYEVVLASNKESVKEYIENNIDDYVSKILLNANITCENESSENMLRLLSNKKITVEHKKALISKIKVKFDDVKQFAPDLYDALFDNDSIVPTWKNIQIAYETKGFECVEDFIKRNKMISGEFVGIDGINVETPTNLINDILLNLGADDISQVVKTLPAVTILSAINTETSDINLSRYIRGGRIKFDISDLSILADRKKSLIEYINHFSKEIEDNFDEFFSEELNQSSYASIVSDVEIDNLIKEKLIETDYNLIKIEGYEQIYADYILSGHAVPTEILWQFSNTSLDSDQKLKILEICDYGGEVEETSEIKQYLMSAISAFKNIFGTQKEATIEKTDRNKKLLDILFDRKIISSYKKVRNRDEYSVKAA